MTRTALSPSTVSYYYYYYSTRFKPALCGSRPLVNPYYRRLGDLLCFVFMSAYCMFDLSVYYLFLQYFDTVGWVFLTCKNRLTYNLYCVGGDVKHCSVQSNTGFKHIKSFSKLNNLKCERSQCRRRKARLYTVFRKKTPTRIFFHISMNDVWILTKIAVIIPKEW